MIFRYDLHIHSALSPCADREMTPASIVGTAKLSGLDFVAIADHNAIENVGTALACGEAYGINVIPAIELQTSEDVHILCLFKTYGQLEAFYEAIDFSPIANRRDIFGEQQIIDEDDNVVGEIERMLLASADISSEDVYAMCRDYGGAAVPAHIDRDMNGMVQMLGDISGGYRCVELSSSASDEERAKWEEDYLVITDSDAHTLGDISLKGAIELEEGTVSAFIDRLRKGK